MNGLETRTLKILRKIFPKEKIDCQIEDLPGRPDFAIMRLRLIIFVDGDFWHGGHQMRMLSLKHYAAADIAKAEFWHNKQKENKERDRRVNRELKELGYDVVRLKERKLNGYRPEIYIGQAVSNKLIKTSKKLRANTN